MKFSKQVFAIFLVVFMVSCAADSKETVVSKKTITKTAPVSTRNQNPIDEIANRSQGDKNKQSPTSSNQLEAQKQPRANANNIVQSNQSSKPKARYSSGTANHLGGKLGVKLCKCLKNEDTNKCAEINQRINDVKQSMNPEILTIFEKAFNAAKEEC